MKDLDDLLSKMGLSRSDLPEDATHVAIDKSGDVFAWKGCPVYVSGECNDFVHQDEWAGCLGGVRYATIPAYLGDVYIYLPQHAKMDEMIFPVE